MRALSTRNDEPERASRPWDKDRDGFVVGEGAGILVLEALDFAKSRGANILAEIVGYGMSADAFHVTAPPDDGGGAFRVMRNAMKDAGLRPEQIDYINAHGTSTDVGDRAETMAIKRAFGDHAYKVAVSSPTDDRHITGRRRRIQRHHRDGHPRCAPPTVKHECPDPARMTMCAVTPRCPSTPSRRVSVSAAPAAASFSSDLEWQNPFLKCHAPNRAATVRNGSPGTAHVWTCESGESWLRSNSPARDSQLRIASSGQWIDEEDITHEINEPDAYALEEGLQLKEKHGGEVVALCFGPARAAQTIREALAKGADRAIHIEDENPGAFDPLAAAGLMAAPLKAERRPVLTGLQSDDLVTGDRTHPRQSCRTASRHHHQEVSAARFA
jgi:hypothetical protein